MTTTAYQRGRVGGPAQPADSDPVMATCLFCEQPATGALCLAFVQAGVAAHATCCGCAAWAGWARPGISALDLDGLPAERCGVQLAGR